MYKNKLSYLLLILSLILTYNFLHLNVNQFNSDPSVTIKWKTENEFKTPESVLFDAVNNIIYVSNINGSPMEKDRNGFISKLGLDGKIINLEWITGLNAPKGMGIYGSKLFVADINRVIEIDINSGKIVDEYSSPKAQFLNDITVHSSGVVYISDNVANIIFQLEEKEIKPWLVSPILDLPNGLFAEENYLLIGMNNSILSVDYKDKNIKSIINNTDFIDGLVSRGDGTYLISDFSGAIHSVEPGKDKVKIIDTTDEEIMAADIDYIIDKRLLIVPTFTDNRVFAYEL
ncbi:MAG: hypothetical protein PVF17_09750, partial [Ignavibacteria bacterium]|jgi:hypothetical protein